MPWPLLSGILYPLCDQRLVRGVRFDPEPLPAKALRDHGRRPRTEERIEYDPAYRRPGEHAALDQLRGHGREMCARVGLRRDRPDGAGVSLKRCGRVEQPAFCAVVFVAVCVRACATMPLVAGCSPRRNFL